MNRLIVAFPSDTAARRICAWLAQSGFPARTVCHTGAEVVRAVHYMGGGSVICAARLPDYTADELYDDLDGQADLLVIGKPEQLIDCENPAIRRLPLPVSRSQLAEAAEALTQAQQARVPAKPSQQDQEIIRHAKTLLQARRGMTEPEAHRYLQRRSMESHRRMAATAQLVIAALENKA